MITKEIINGKEIEIEWEFIDIEETHSTGAEWNVKGKGSDGREYQGSCFADLFDSKLNTGEVLNIEQL